MARWVGCSPISDSGDTGIVGFLVEGMIAVPGRVKVEGDLYHGHVPEGAVYVGRAAPGLHASPFANPFPVKKHGRAEAIRLYRGYLMDNPELLAQARRDLAGRDLACWCGQEQECHADVLLQIANEKHP